MMRDLQCLKRDNDPRLGKRGSTEQQLVSLQREGGNTVNPHQFAAPIVTSAFFPLYENCISNNHSGYVSISRLSLFQPQGRSKANIRREHGLSKVEKHSGIIT